MTTVQFLRFLSSPEFPYARMVVLGFALIAVSAPAWGQEQGAKDVAAASASKAQKERTAQPADYEDWTSPDLETSHLLAVPPLVGEKDDMPDFTRELLQVQWRAADAIDLYVIRPKGVEEPPVILFLYGHPADSDKFQNDDFCNLLVKGGFAAVGFAPALSGHRFHERPMKEWYVSEMQETLGASAHDVQMVLNYLATRGDLDMSRVGMFGEGTGGSIRILAAAVDPRIKVLDALNPWGDWPEWMAKST